MSFDSHFEDLPREVYRNGSGESKVGAVAVHVRWSELREGGLLKKC